MTYNNIINIAIKPIFNYPQVFRRPAVRPVFSGKADVFEYTGATAISDKSFDESGHLKEVNFSQPLTPSDAIGALLQDEQITKSLLMGGRRNDELLKFKEDLANADAMKNLKVKSLIGCGAYALAFEMDDGNVLKITPLNHFEGRKPEDFDLPLIASGHLGTFTPNYYYIEEKVSQNDLSQEEMRDVVERIIDKGYVVHDIKENGKDFYSDLDAALRCDQFGRASDGKVYLIDPGCVKLLSFSDIIGFFF